MNKPTNREWWVTDAKDNGEHIKLVGPFTTDTDASVAREYMEQTASDKNDIEFATKQLLDLLDKVIGEDEPADGFPPSRYADNKRRGRNQLRQTQRLALKEMK